MLGDMIEEYVQARRHLDEALAFKARTASMADVKAEAIRKWAKEVAWQKLRLNHYPAPIKRGA